MHPRGKCKDTNCKDAGTIAREFAWMQMNLDSVKLGYEHLEKIHMKRKVSRPLVFIGTTLEAVVHSFIILKYFPYACRTFDVAFAVSLCILLKAEWRWHERNSFWTTLCQFDILRSFEEGKFLYLLPLEFFSARSRKFSPSQTGCPNFLLFHFSNFWWVMWNFYQECLHQLEEWRNCWVMLKCLRKLTKVWCAYFILYLVLE